MGFIWAASAMTLKVKRHRTDLAWHSKLWFGRSVVGPIGHGEIQPRSDCTLSHQIRQKRAKTQWYVPADSSSGQPAVASVTFRTPTAVHAQTRHRFSCPQQLPSKMDFAVDITWETEEAAPYRSYYLFRWIPDGISQWRNPLALGRVGTLAARSTSARPAVPLCRGFVQYIDGRPVQPLCAVTPGCS